MLPPHPSAFGSDWFRRAEMSLRPVLKSADMTAY